MGVAWPLTAAILVCIMGALMPGWSVAQPTPPAERGGVVTGPVEDISVIRPGRSRRVSSWDRSGGNADMVVIPGGETQVLADIPGAGKITHIYMTMISPDFMDYRDAVLRMYWDGETSPSVEVPLGDFFCVSNCVVRHFSSAFIAVNPGGGPNNVDHGFNCYFPMPFARGARIELANESARVLGGDLGGLWYHIDYETFDEPPSDSFGRFHAQWRRENLTVPASPPQTARGMWKGSNLTGDDNYVLLEAQGEGHVAGVFLQVDNVQGDWYGEGDDMIFLDGEKWPPSIHGTGSEEIFGGGACPDKEYVGLYSGYLLVENAGGKTFQGKNAMYRWYVHDPLRFRTSIRMTVEHGHANDYANDYSSVVYWYQKEPHAPFPMLPSADARRPILPDEAWQVHELWQRVRASFGMHMRRLLTEGATPPPWIEDMKISYASAQTHFFSQEYAQAREHFLQALEVIQRNEE